jgi:hypothetical protein
MYYQCRKCNYTTKKRSLIVRHLNNKFPCRNQTIKVDRSTNFDDLKLYKNDTEYDAESSEDDENSNWDIDSQFTDVTAIEDAFLEIVND